MVFLICDDDVARSRSGVDSTLRRYYFHSNRNPRHRREVTVCRTYPVSSKCRPIQAYPSQPTPTTIQCSRGSLGRKWYASSRHTRRFQRFRLLTYRYIGKPLLLDIIPLPDISMARVLTVYQRVLHSTGYPSYVAIMSSSPPHSTMPRARSCSSTTSSHSQRTHQPWSTPHSRMFSP